MAELDTAPPRLPASASDTSGPSYDMASVSVAVLSPIVATSLSDVDTPAAVMHSIDVSDAHSVLSHPVKPTCAAPLYVLIPSRPDPAT